MSTGTERVALLAEMLVLLGTDAASIYATRADAAETLREFPRTAVAAGILFGGLFLAADLGAGVPAALFGGLVAISFIVFEWSTIARLFNTATKTQLAVQAPQTATQPGGAATK